MSQGPMLTDDGLPAGAAEQLRAAARAGAEGSVPYPRLAVAIRRDRRRRAASGVAVGVAAVLAATIVTSAVRADRPTLPSNRGAEPTQEPRPSPSRTADPGPAGDPYDLAGRTGGALGADAAWLRGMRQRVVGHGRASDAAHARVLWASDQWGRRFALTIAQEGAVWTLEQWEGARGAAPSAMTYRGGTGTTAAAAGVRPVMRPWYATFRPSGGNPTASSALLVAVADRLSLVEVGSDFDYTADGHVTATWRPLEPAVAVWTGVVTMPDSAGLAVRARTADGLRRRVYGGGSPYVQTVVPPGLVAASPPGTDPDVLSCAAMAFAPSRGGFPPGATPVLGGAPKVGLEYFGVAVARAVGGGYLIGSCPTLDPDSGNSRFASGAAGFVVPAPAGGPDELFAVLPSIWNEGQIGEGLSKGRVISGQLHDAAVVIAPVGATEVEVAGKTVPVHDRLAIVTDVSDEGLPAVARDAAGRELGRTGRAPDQREVADDSFYDVP